MVNSIESAHGISTSFPYSYSFYDSGSQKTRGNYDTYRTNRRREQRTPYSDRTDSQAKADARVCFPLFGFFGIMFYVYSLRF